MASVGGIRESDGGGWGCGLVSPVPLSTGAPAPLTSPSQCVVGAPTPTTVAAVLLHNAVHSLSGHSSMQHMPIGVKHRYTTFSIKVALQGDYPHSQSTLSSDPGMNLLEVFFRDVCGVGLKEVLQLITDPSVSDPTPSRLGPFGEFAVNMLYALQHQLRDVMVLMSSQEAGSPSRRDALVEANPDKQVAIPALSRLEIIMCSVAILVEGVRDLPVRRWAASESEGSRPLANVPEANVPCIADMGKSVGLGVHSNSPIVRYLRVAKVEWEVAPINIKSTLLHRYVAQWASRLLGPYPESWPADKNVDRHVVPDQASQLNVAVGVPGKRDRSTTDLADPSGRNGYDTLHTSLHRDPVTILVGRQVHSERLLQRLGGGGPRTVPSANVLTAGKFSTDLLRGVSFFLRNDCPAESLALARSAVKDSQQTESGELTVMSSHIHHHIAAMQVGNALEAAVPLGLVLRSTRGVDAVTLGGRQEAGTPTGAKLALFIQMRIAALLAACEMLIHFPTSVPDEIRHALRETSTTVHNLLHEKIAVLEKTLTTNKPKSSKRPAPTPTTSSAAVTSYTPMVLASLSMAENLSYCLPITSSAFKESCLRQVSLLADDMTSIDGSVSTWGQTAHTSSTCPLVTCNRHLSRSYNTAEEEVSVREFVSRVSSRVLSTLRGSTLSASVVAVGEGPDITTLSPASQRQVAAAECALRSLVCLEEGRPHSLSLALGLCYGGLDLCRIPPPQHISASLPSLQTPLNAAAVSVVVSLLHLVGECGRRMSLPAEMCRPTTLHMAGYLSDRITRPPQDHIEYATSTLSWLAGPSVRSSAALAALSQLSITTKDNNTI